MCPASRSPCSSSVRLCLSRCTTHACVPNWLPGQVSPLPHLPVWPILGIQIRMLHVNHGAHNYARAHVSVCRGPNAKFVGTRCNRGLDLTACHASCLPFLTRSLGTLCRHIQTGLYQNQSQVQGASKCAAAPPMPQTPRPCVCPGHYATHRASLERHITTAPSQHHYVILSSAVDRGHPC